MKLLTISIILLLSLIVSAKTIKVAIIDTGVNDKIGLPLCLSGHKTFYGDDFDDEYGHGRYVAEIIKQQAKNVDYCMIIVKVFDKYLSNSLIKGIEYVSTLDVDFVNISGGGAASDINELKAINSMLKRGVIIVVAAGNGGKNLDVKCNYFPACYGKDLVVVGQKKSKKSNYGKVVDIEAPGVVTLKNGTVMEGTSFSTAYVTGNLIRVKAKNVKK